MRRFLTTDPVKAIFAFAATIESDQFDIRQISPPQYLSEFLDKSIGETSLAGSKIVICAPQQKS